jgi:hypothetical protein
MSQARTIANQRNAQKSTGPRTPQGKAIVSQNALKHGLTASQIVIKSEDQAQFDLHRTQLFDELAPDTPIESLLVERIVELSWRLRRAGNLQSQTIDALTTPKNNQFTKLQQMLITKYMGTSETGPVESDPDLALGRMVVKDFSNSRVLEKLLMRERRIEGSLYRTILELQRLKMIKNLKAEPRN